MHDYIGRHMLYAPGGSLLVVLAPLHYILDDKLSQESHRLELTTL